MIFLVFVMVEHSSDVNSNLYIILFPHLINPIKNITVTCEGFLIMAIALERLLAVSKPIRYRLGILRRSQRVHALVFILPPLVFSVVLNIPKFFEYEHVNRNITNEDENSEIILDYDMTDLRFHPDYIYYYIHWIRFITTGIIPIIFLIIVNAAIYILLPSDLHKQPHCRTVSFKRSQEDRDKRKPMTETRSIETRRSIQSSDSIISKLSSSDSFRSTHSQNISIPEDPFQETSNSSAELISIQCIQVQVHDSAKHIDSSEGVPKLRNSRSFRIRYKNTDKILNQERSRQRLSSSRSIKQSDSIISRVSCPSMDMIPEDQSLQNLRKQIRLGVRRRPASTYSTVTLLAIVIMYIVCNIPRLVLNLAEHLLQDQISNNFDVCGCEKFPTWFIILVSINHFLLTVNSSANFIIYSSLEKKFKTTLRDIAESIAEKTRMRWTPAPEQSNSSYTDRSIGMSVFE